MSINSLCQFRIARPQDVDAAVLLIFSSGPQAIEYGFSHADRLSQDFLRFAFLDGRGFFGFRNHTVATINGEVVGIAAFYNFASYLRLTREHIWQLWRFYPVRDVMNLFIRGVHLKSTMPPPGRGMHYVAHFGVKPEARGMGVGTRLLDDQCGFALDLGLTHLGLDVSVENPRAKALYTRYGFVDNAENLFSGPLGAVPNTRRMTKVLTPTQRAWPT